MTDLFIWFYAGQFYVPGESNKSVTGLSSDQENCLLVTGDTTGSIKVWDISQYALLAKDKVCK